MRFLKFLLPILVLGIVVFAPYITFAAETSALNKGWSLIPEQCLCDAEHNNGVDSAPDFGCVGYVIANIMNLLFSLGIVIFVLVASYSGFLFMASSVNPSGKEKAKSMLTNAGVGLFIALGAWLMVDFIMDALYNDAWGPWESILDNKAASECLVVNTPPAGSVPGTPTNTGGVTAGPGTSTGGGTGMERGPNANWASFFGFQSGISSQQGHASGAVSSLLSCMAGTLESNGHTNVSQISSISDCQIAGNCSNGLPDKSWADCQDGQCQHAARSCHYGGTCTSQHRSYAVDFGNENSASLLKQAAAACNPNTRWNFEGDHLHLSVGAESCGCDTGLPKVGN